MPESAHSLRTAAYKTQNINESCFMAQLLPVSHVTQVVNERKPCALATEMCRGCDRSHPRMQPLLMATDGLREENGISRRRQREVSGYCTNSTITQSWDTSLTCPSHQPNGCSILAFHCTSIYPPGLKGDAGFLHLCDPAQT